MKKRESVSLIPGAMDAEMAPPRTPHGGQTSSLSPSRNLRPVGLPTNPLTGFPLLPCILFVLLLAAPAPAADITGVEADRIMKLIESEDRDERLEGVKKLAEFKGANTLRVLVWTMKSPDWLVREAAIDALPKQDSKSALKVLQHKVDDRDPRVRGAAFRCAGRILGAQSLEVLKKAAEDGEPRVRIAAAEALAEVPFAGDKTPQGRSHLTLLGKLSEDDDPRVRVQAVLGLGEMKDSDLALRLLCRACADAPEEAVFRAGEILSKNEAFKDFAFFAKLGRDRDEENRVAACIALGMLGKKEGDQTLFSALRDRKWQVRAAGCDAMGRIAPEDENRLRLYESRLLPALADKDWGVRTCAAWALARLGSAKAVEPMIRRVDKPEDFPIVTILQKLCAQPKLEGRKPWSGWYRKNKSGLKVERTGEIKSASEITYHSLADKSENVVYVLDISGSMMYYNRMDLARRELWNSVSSLEHDTGFNLILFSTEVILCSKAPLRANWRNKARLKNYLDKVSPAGNTNISLALFSALDQYDVETIFFLTDGLPTEGILIPKEIVKQTTETNMDRRRPARIFTIALNIPEAAKLLSNLADWNEGEYKLVQEVMEK